MSCGGFCLSYSGVFMLQMCLNRDLWENVDTDKFWNYFFGGKFVGKLEIFDDFNFKDFLKIIFCLKKLVLIFCFLVIKNGSGFALII